jgi:hypothetical protein
VVFYATVAEGGPRLLAIVWAWVAVVWVAINQLVAPLSLHLRGVGLLGIYRRAALLIASYPLFWLVQVAAAIVVAVLCTAVLPLYLLAGGAYVALVQAHAFRAHRIAAGDVDVDEPA